MFHRKLKTGDNNEPDDDPTSLGPVFTGRGLLSIAIVSMRGMARIPRIQERESESEQR
jgi:hypothetical protein